MAGSRGAGASVYTARIVGLRLLFHPLSRGASWPVRCHADSAGVFLAWPRHDGRVAHVVLFHSVYGRRPAVLAAAGRLRAAGHTVIAPDLYAGQLAATVDEGFALCAQIGWPVIVGRARQALDGLPAETVLAGLSMGASVAAALLGERPGVAGLLLLHNTGGRDAEDARPGLPLQLHIADPDVYQPAAEVIAWEQDMTDAGAAVEVFRYPGAGHLFTDPGAPGHDSRAAGLAWRRSLRFLGVL
jgi:dienelactone hydrolase